MAGKLTARHLWPAPVYVGTLANGSTVRASLAQLRGKPLDFEQGRRICASRIILPPNPGRFATYEMVCTPEIREMYQHPVIAGHIMLDGERIDDPHFSGVVVPLPVRTRRKPAAAPGCCPTCGQALKRKESVA